MGSGTRARWLAQGLTQWQGVIMGDLGPSPTAKLPKRHDRGRIASIGETRSRGVGRLGARRWPPCPLPAMSAPGTVPTAQDTQLAAEFSGILCDLGEALSKIALGEAANQRKASTGGRKKKDDARTDWAQAIEHVDVMLSNESHEVQVGASRAHQLGSARDSKPSPPTTLPHCHRPDTAWPSHWWRYVR